MKIVHIITTLHRGGAEKQLLTLVKQQSRLGHEIYIIPLKGNIELTEFYKIPNSKVIEDFLRISFFYQIFKLRNFISKEIPSVLHLHLPRGEVLYALATFLFLRCNLVAVLASRHNAETFNPKRSAIISRC